MMLAVMDVEETNVNYWYSGCQTVRATGNGIMMALRLRLPGIVTVRAAYGESPRRPAGRRS